MWGSGDGVRRTHPTVSAGERCWVVLDEQEHRGRGPDRGPYAQADQPGQGPVSRSWLHQGAGDRLLHADGARAPSPHPQPPADAQAVSQRSGRGILLREELSEASSAVGGDGDGVERSEKTRYVLLSLSGESHAGGAGPQCTVVTS